MPYNAIAANVLQLITSDESFEALASKAFDFHARHCAPFREFLSGIGSPAFSIDNPSFLPIELFKSHRVFSASTSSRTFLSSGTASAERSQHHFSDLELYSTTSQAHFESLYGSLSSIRILALLPSYLEQGESSLVFMVDHFMKQTAAGASHFFLSDFAELQRTLLMPFEGTTLLIGVSYALLDFAATKPTLPEGIIIMETGGMKGRKKELTREELQGILIEQLNVASIHSEYGMTELSSQAYSQGDGWFKSPAWMRAFVTDVSDPLSQLPAGRRGCLAFIDLANRDSCAFIQTRDIGIVLENGSFKVEGRMDQSDLRGCNLLYT